MRSVVPEIGHDARELRLVAEQPGDAHPATDHLDFALRSETTGADGRVVVKVDVTKVERQHAPGFAQLSAPERSATTGPLNR